MSFKKRPSPDHDLISHATPTVAALATLHTFRAFINIPLTHISKCKHDIFWERSYVAQSNKSEETSKCSHGCFHGEITVSAVSCARGDSSVTVPVYRSDINTDLCNLFYLAICQPQWGDDDNASCHLLALEVCNVFYGSFCFSLGVHMNIQCYKHNSNSMLNTSIMHWCDRRSIKDKRSFFQSTLATEMWKTETTPL